MTVPVQHNPVYASGRLLPVGIPSRSMILLGAIWCRCQLIMQEACGAVPKAEPKAI
jgi:hypothetical protein